VNERRAGDYAQAAATLERALRIEPGSAAVWLELARVRLAQGDYVQAGQLARKAGSLATGQPALAAASQAVLAEALERQGQSP
jgi:Tfp pilus assembly protein PilF